MAPLSSSAFTGVVVSQSAMPSSTSRVNDVGLGVAATVYWRGRRFSHLGRCRVRRIIVGLLSDIGTEGMSFSETNIAGVESSSLVCSTLRQAYLFELDNGGIQFTRRRSENPPVLLPALLL